MERWQSNTAADATPFDPLPSNAQSADLTTAPVVLIDYYEVVRGGHKHFRAVVSLLAATAGTPPTHDE